jgi:hydroxymethylglutaryl-CoA synthase
MNEHPIGIVGYGAVLPRYRIRVTEIADAWGMDGESYRRGLALEEKAVPAPDQDAVTFGVEAARAALKRARMDPSLIGALYVGSESHPYAVKPSGTILAEALGATPDVHLADMEFACKAGTEAMHVCAEIVLAGRVRYALAVGADTSQGAPGDPLEFATAAGGAAFVFGKENLVATLDAVTTHVTDTPDFWRREGRPYPRHGGRFTGEPGYFGHVTTVANKAMAALDLSPRDIHHVVLHQPNGKFPARAAKRLGFSKEQTALGLLAPEIGNTYSASSPMGLCAVLDAAGPRERILLVSYGSGAGSDAFVFTTTDRLPATRDAAPKLRSMIDGPTLQLTYGQYARFRRKIVREEE